MEYNGWTPEKLDEFEDDIANEFRQGHIRFPIHLSKGNSQNLIEIFSDNQIGISDFVFSTHRSHLHALLKGIHKEWLKDQIMHGNSMHIMSKEYKFFSSSIVGGSLPIAVGLAWAIKKQGLNERVFAFLGDMAALSGIAHECINYSNWNNLPIKFIIEDNGLSTNSPTYNTWGEWVSFPDNNDKVQYYEYKRECSHINITEHVEFK